jgi:hypothetical protein
VNTKRLLAACQEGWAASFGLGARGKKRLGNAVYGSITDTDPGGDGAFAKAIIQ